MSDGDGVSEPDHDAPIPVLEVFGMALTVKNRRLAEVLTRDAADIFSRDRRVSEEHTGAPPSLPAELVAEALPDVLLAPPSVRDSADDQVRADLKRRCDHVGEHVGVHSPEGGQWCFDDGLTVHVRVIARTATPAAAADVIRKLREAVLSPGTGPRSVLLVTPDDGSSHVMCRAVDALEARCSFRVIDIRSLERLGSVSAASADPQAVFSFALSPQASVAWPDVLAGMGEGPTS